MKTSIWWQLPFQTQPKLSAMEARVAEQEVGASKNGSRLHVRRLKGIGSGLGLLEGVVESLVLCSVPGFGFSVWNAAKADCSAQLSAVVWQSVSCG